MNSKKNSFLLYFRFFAVALTLFGMVYRLIIEPISGNGWYQFFDMLGYFTIQSGLMVLAVFISLLVNQLKDTPEKAVKPAVRGAVQLYIIVTSLIFLTMLNSRVDTQGISTFVIYINHLATAILLVIDNILSVEAGSFKWKYILYWLIYPFAYLLFSVFEGLAYCRFRYFFLNFYEQSWKFYILYIILLIVIFVLISFISIFLNNFFKKKVN